MAMDIRATTILARGTTPAVLGVADIEDLGATGDEIATMSTMRKISGGGRSAIDEVRIYRLIV